MNYLHALLLLPIAAAEGYNYSHLEDNLLKFSEHAYVLVKGWKVGSPMGMFGSTLIVFLLCIVHEALEGLRYFLAKEHSLCAHDAMSQMSFDSRNKTPISISSFSGLLRKVKNSFTGYRVTQSLLYGVHTLLGYLLILIVVSFNVWLILAVVLGKAVGYFMFTGSPTVERTSLITSGHAAGMIEMQRPSDFQTSNT